MLNTTRKLLPYLKFICIYSSLQQSNGNKVHSKDKPALKTCQHRNLKNPWSGMPLATKQRSHVHKIRRGLRFGRPGYSMKQLFKGLKVIIHPGVPNITFRASKLCIKVKLTL